MRANTVKTGILPKFIYGFNAILIKAPADAFADTDKPRRRARDPGQRVTLEPSYLPIPQNAAKLQQPRPWTPVRTDRDPWERSDSLAMAPRVCGRRGHPDPSVGGGRAFQSTELGRLGSACRRREGPLPHSRHKA